MKISILVGSKKLPTNNQYKSIIIFFTKILNTFQKVFKKMSQNVYDFFPRKNNEKKGSFVASWIFFHPFLKNFSLPKNEESALFFVNFIGIILVLGHKS